jgi:hypothetical protein
MIKSANVIFFGICYPPPRSYYSLQQQKKLVSTGEYKPEPPKLSNNDSSTPGSAVVHTTENGRTQLSLRNPGEVERLKNLPIKTVGKPVSQSIVNVEEGIDVGLTGGRGGGGRKSDTGIIGSTMEDIEGFPISIESQDDRPKSEPIEVLGDIGVGDTSGGNTGGGDTGDDTMQGPSEGGYKSRLIEKIDIESEPPPQEQTQQQTQQQPPSPSTSSIRTFVSGAVKRLGSISSNSRKGSQRSKKGKAKEDDDQKDQDKKDDG